MPVLKSTVWARVETVIEEQALFAAQLLGGQLPAELEDVVAAAGGKLFPESFADLKMRCTCPDWGMPCKHLAAAFYLLAETFDDDPFRILLWRGRSREQLLAGISGATGATSQAGTPSTESPEPIGAATGSPTFRLFRVWADRTFLAQSRCHRAHRPSTLPVICCCDSFPGPPRPWAGHDSGPLWRTPTGN
jgi:uncharacterized Zn finger protein